MKTACRPIRLSGGEISVLRDLAARYAAMAALPVQKEKKALWQALTNLNMIRPMVAVDQIPWHECSDPSLILTVEQPFWRGIEQELRRKLFQWSHFPADMVADPVLPVAKAFSDSGFGFQTQEDTASLDP